MWFSDILIEVFGEGILQGLWWLFRNGLKYTGIFLQMFFTGFQKTWSEFIKKSEKNYTAFWLGFLFYAGLIAAYFLS